MLFPNPIRYTPVHATPQGLEKIRARVSDALGFHIRLDELDADQVCKIERAFVCDLSRMEDEIGMFVDAEARRIRLKMIRMKQFITYPVTPCTAQILAPVADKRARGSELELILQPTRLQVSQLKASRGESTP